MANVPYDNWGASMPKGVGARFYEVCDSTNLVARQFAEEIGNTPTWIVAGIQTTGRGRQGRTWVSESGNLYTTLVFKPNLKPSDMKALPYIFALAVRDSFLTFGAEGVQCKWPNDVLIKDNKASGILIETVPAPDGNMFILVGIGMNLIHSPRDTRFPATSLKAEVGKVVSPQEAITVLAEKVQNRLNAWNVSSFAPIRADWQAAAWGLGSKQTISTDTKEYQATLLGLTNEGGLEVVLDTGEKDTIFAADIFPGL